MFCKCVLPICGSGHTMQIGQSVLNKKYFFLIFKVLLPVQAAARHKQLTLATGGSHTSSQPKYRSILYLPKNVFSLL